MPAETIGGYHALRMNPNIATEERKSEVLGNLVIDLDRKGKLNEFALHCINRSRERLRADSTVEYRDGAVFTRELTENSC